MKIQFIPLIALCLLLAASYLLGYTPPLIAATYLLMSLITFVFYAWDKSAAGNGRRRIPENTLQLLALAGGWPGAIVGQQLLRHKTQKTRFRLVFYSSVLLNFVMLLWLHTAQGQAVLHALVSNT